MTQPVPPVRNPLRKVESQGQKAEAGQHAGTQMALPKETGSRGPHRTTRTSHCPDCSSTLARRNVSPKRYIEDIPQHVRVEMTGHTIHPDWCPRCRKMVEPKVPDALPHAMIGDPKKPRSGARSCHRRKPWKSDATKRDLPACVRVFGGSPQMCVTTANLAFIHPKYGPVLARRRLQPESPSSANPEAMPFS